MEAQLSPYDILGVTPDSEETEIRSAYRGLILQFHPDVNPDPTAVEHAKRITVAYRQLMEMRRLGPSIWADQSEEPQVSDWRTEVPDYAAVLFTQASPESDQKAAKTALSVMLAVLLIGLAWMALSGLRAYKAEEDDSSELELLRAAQPRTLAQQMEQDRFLITVTPEMAASSPQDEAERARYLELTKLQVSLANQLVLEHRQMASSLKDAHGKQANLRWADYYRLYAQLLQLKAQALTDANRTAEVNRCAKQLSLAKSAAQKLDAALGPSEQGLFASRTGD